MDPHVPTWAGYMHGAPCREDFPPWAGPQLRVHVPPASLKTFCFPSSTAVYVSIAQSTLASYHLWFCFIFVSLLPVALGGPALAALACRLCGSDLIWRDCRREASGSPQGSRDFCTPWQELKPRTRPLQLLGSLPWVTYSPRPHVHLTPNCSSPIRVLSRQFISSALERASLFLT